jgi:hypothetical protein
LRFIWASQHLLGEAVVSYIGVARLRRGGQMGRYYFSAGSFPALHVVVGMPKKILIGLGAAFAVILTVSGLNANSRSRA